MMPDSSPEVDRSVHGTLQSFADGLRSQLLILEKVSKEAEDLVLNEIVAASEFKTRIESMRKKHFEEWKEKIIQSEPDSSLSEAVESMKQKLVSGDILMHKITARIRAMERVCADCGNIPEVNSANKNLEAWKAQSKKIQDELVQKQNQWVAQRVEQFQKKRALEQFCGALEEVQRSGDT